MPAYAIAGIEVTEPEAYAAYARGVPATLEPYGGRFVVRGGALEVIEGQWPAARTVILPGRPGCSRRAHRSNGSQP